MQLVFFFFFSLTAFKILFVSLAFYTLICVPVYLFGFLCFGILWAPQIQTSVSFTMLGMFSAISIKFSVSASFSLSSPFQTPVMQILVCLILFHKSFKQSSHYFILCDFSSCLYEFHCHVFEFTDPFFASSSLLLDSPSVFHSIIVFFKSVTSVQHFLYIFSVFVEVLTVFILSSSEFGEDFYDLYFELFIRLVSYLNFIKDFFLRFFPLVLQFGTSFSLSSLCLTPCVSVYALDKTNPSPNLEVASPRT